MGRVQARGLMRERGKERRRVEVARIRRRQATRQEALTPPEASEGKRVAHRKTKKEEEEATRPLLAPTAGTAQSRRYS